MDGAVIAVGVLLLIGAGVVFALSVWVGILLGRRMDRALEARQAAESALRLDQAPDGGEEIGLDE